MMTVVYCKQASGSVKSLARGLQCKESVERDKAAESEDRPYSSFGVGYWRVSVLPCPIVPSYIAKYGHG